MAAVSDEPARAIPAPAHLHHDLSRSRLLHDDLLLSAITIAAPVTSICLKD